MKLKYDVAVIGGGPAGLAAALAVDKAGASTLLIEREAALGKDYDLDKLPDVSDWKYPYVRERAAFIHQFYRYAQANPDGQPLGWRAWVAVSDRAQE